MAVVQKEKKAETRQALKGPAQEDTHKAADRALKAEAKKLGYEEGRGLLKPKATPAEAPKPSRQPEDGARPDPLKDPKAQPDAKTEHLYGTLDPSYSKIKGKPFIKEEDDSDEVAMDDVAQGRLGDCYFVASLAAIAGKNPDAIRKMIKNNGDGTYTVTFHEGGAVVVDDQFPAKDGNPVYAGAGDKDSDGVELWVMLIEKAWAKLKGGYEQIRGSKVQMKSPDAMQAMTGNKTTTILTGSTAGEDLLKALDEAHQKGLPMTAGTYDDKHFDEETLKKMGAKGVHGNHAYAIVSVDAKKKTIELYNPWGKEYAHPVLDVAEFKKYYETVHINAK